MTVTGDLLVTSAAHVPEQALAKRVAIDHRADIYSLGVTLYELLTFEPAFQADDRQELLKKIAFEEPRSPRKLDNSIPVELDTIILKAIQKNPEDRYASANEFAEDLQCFLDHKPIRARPTTLRDHVRNGLGVTSMLFGPQRRFYSLRLWCCPSLTFLLSTARISKASRIERAGDVRIWSRVARKPASSQGRSGGGIRYRNRSAST